jgi:hypothetical protein
MKMKFSWVALLASAAMIAQANAGGHLGGGGGSNFAASVPRPAPSFHGGGARGFGGGRMMYSGRRFGAAGFRSVQPMGTHQRQFASNSARYGKVNRALPSTRRDIGAGQARRGNDLPGNWRNHVVAQHSANWQRNWDRHRDHVWHGHHCRFINGSWAIFDFGFYPWWGYGYPYDYYGYDYYGYPYGYDQDEYRDNDEYYGGNAYGSSDQYTDSLVVAAQQRLTQQGYYRGEIDGVSGPRTRRAIARYQSRHGLRVTGNLTTATLRALGLERVASD